MPFFCKAREQLSWVWLLAAAVIASSALIVKIAALRTEVDVLAPAAACFHACQLTDHPAVAKQDRFWPDTVVRPENPGIEAYVLDQPKRESGVDLFVTVPIRLKTWAALWPFFVIVNQAARFVRPVSTETNTVSTPIALVLGHKVPWWGALLAACLVPGIFISAGPWLEADLVRNSLAEACQLAVVVALLGIK